MADFYTMVDGLSGLVWNSLLIGDADATGGTAPVSSSSTGGLWSVTIGAFNVEQGPWWRFNLSPSPYAIVVRFTDFTHPAAAENIRISLIGGNTIDAPADNGTGCGYRYNTGTTNIAAWVRNQDSADAYSGDVSTQATVTRVQGIAVNGGDYGIANVIIRPEVVDTAILDANGGNSASLIVWIDRGTNGGTQQTVGFRPEYALVPTP